MNPLMEVIGMTPYCHKIFIESHCRWLRRRQGKISGLRIILLYVRPGFSNCALMQGLNEVPVFSRGGKQASLWPLSPAGPVYTDELIKENRSWGNSTIVQDLHPSVRKTCLHHLPSTLTSICFQKGNTKCNIHKQIKVPLIFITIFIIP